VASGDIIGFGLRKDEELGVKRLPRTAANGSQPRGTTMNFWKFKLGFVCGYTVATIRQSKDMVWTRSSRLRTPSADDPGEVAAQSAD